MLEKKLGGSSLPMSPFYFNAVMLWHGFFLEGLGARNDKGNRNDLQRV